MMKLSIALALRNPAASNGVAGAIERKPAIDRTLAPKSPELTKCLCGSIRGFDDMRPANLRNATIEPVNVTPPATTRQQMSLISEAGMLTNEDP